MDGGGEVWGGAEDAEILEQRGLCSPDGGVAHTEAALARPVAQQLDRLLGLEGQLLALQLGVVGQDQLDGRVGVAHGVLPAAQRGLHKGPHSARVLACELLGGKEHIAHKLHAVIARQDQADLRTLAARSVRLIRRVDRPDVHAPL